MDTSFTNTRNDIKSANIDQTDWAVLSTFSASSAAMVDEYGRLIPIASIALDMVLAVNIPPHEPAPGQALRSIAASSSSVILPAACSPTAPAASPAARRPASCPTARPPKIHMNGFNSCNQIQPSSPPSAVMNPTSSARKGRYMFEAPKTGPPKRHNTVTNATNFGVVHKMSDNVSYKVLVQVESLS